MIEFWVWINGELSKSAKIWLSKSLFYVKNHPNLSQFFFIEKYQFRSTFFVIDKSFFDYLFLIKWCPIFDSSPLIQTQNSIISFGYVDSYAKIFLILYFPIEDSTTRIAIVIIFTERWKHFNSMQLNLYAGSVWNTYFSCLTFMSTGKCPTRVWFHFHWVPLK